MFPIAGQTAGPNWLIFFVDTHGWPGIEKIENKKKFQHLKKKNSTGNAGPLN